MAVWAAVDLVAGRTLSLTILKQGFPSLTPIGSAAGNRVGDGSSIGRSSNSSDGFDRRW